MLWFVFVPPASDKPRRRREIGVQVITRISKHDEGMAYEWCRATTGLHKPKNKLGTAIKRRLQWHTMGGVDVVLLIVDGTIKKFGKETGIF